MRQKRRKRKLTELNEELLKKLKEKAKDAASQSYSPYSKISVGAAVLSSDGSIYTGANLENASYGLSICAERTAVFKAVLDGKKEFKALAVYSDEVFPLPCGACLQVLSEFFSGNEQIIVSSRRLSKIFFYEELLPQRFKLEKE